MFPLFHGSLDICRARHGFTWSQREKSFLVPRMSALLLCVTSGKRVMFECSVQ